MLVQLLWNYCSLMYADGGTCQECGAAGQFMQNDRLWLRTLCEQDAGDDYKPRSSLKKITVDGVIFTFFDDGQLDALMPSKMAALNKKP